MESDPVDDPPMYIYIKIYVSQVATYRAIVLRTDSYVLQQYFSTHPFPILEITKISYDILKKKENTIEKLMVQYSYHWKPGVPSSPSI